MTSEDFSQLIRSRRSTRDFLDKEIPPAVLAQIFNDARECPSWSNTRPYCVAVASGAQLERLKADYVAAFDKAVPLLRKDWRAIAKSPFTKSLPDSDFAPWKPYPKDLRPRSKANGKQLYTHMGIARGDRDARDQAIRRNMEFFDAPTVLWLFVHKKLLPFSALDAGLMMQTLMLSAKAHGVDSCPIGFLSVWRHPVDKEFQVPRDYKLITGLALGYASSASVNEFRADHPPLNFVPAREPAQEQEES